MIAAKNHWGEWGLLVLRSGNSVAIAATATSSSSRRRRRVDTRIVEEPPQRRAAACRNPSGGMGVAGDLFVVPRRRCHGIAAASLLDLTSQAPSAMATFPERSTRFTGEGPAFDGWDAGGSPGQLGEAGQSRTLQTLYHPLDDSRQQATGSPIRWPLGHRRSSIVGLIRLRTRILSS